MLFKNFSKNLFFQAFISAAMFVGFADAAFAVCKVAVRIETEPTQYCPEGREPWFTGISVCPGDKVKFSSCVTCNLSPVCYRWYRAPIIMSEAPESFSLDKEGNPNGIFHWELRGTEAKLKDTLPFICSTAPNSSEFVSLDLLPTYVYILVVEDPCTGCVAISNPIFVTILPCADLRIEKNCVSRECDKATFEIKVANEGPCPVLPRTILVQDCLPCDLKLENVCGGENWHVRVVNCNDSQCVQAIYRETLQAPYDKTEDAATEATEDKDTTQNNKTTPLFVTVKCHGKDAATNTAYVYSLNPNQFDCNLANNVTSAKIKCKHDDKHDCKHDKNDCKVHCRNLDK